mgnify:CR=1 FL=1
MNEPEKKKETNKETYEEKIARIYDYDPTPEEVMASYPEEFLKEILG